MRITKRRTPRVRVSNSRLELGDFSAAMNSRIDESVLPLKNASIAFNYRTDGGALTSCSGFKRLRSPDLDLELRSLPATPLAAWHYRKYNFDGDYLDDHLLVYCADKMVYCKSFNDMGTTFSSLNLRFEYTPSVVNYRYNGEDILIMCGQREGMVVWDGVNAPTIYSEMVRAGSIAVHYERLFVAEMGSCNRVWFSQDLNPLNFEISSVEGGFIDLVDERGEVVKLVSFLDYLYVFREYGITRITAYGDQTQFAVTQLFTGTGRIYKDTIAVCGDVIYFLASDGLYAFDGLSAHKTCRQLDRLWSNNTPACAAFHGGKYYLACKLDYNDNRSIGGLTDSAYRNTLIELEVRGGNMTLIRGLNVTALSSFRSNFINKLVMAVSNTNYNLYLYEPDGNSGKLDTLNLVKLWRSPKSDFGRPERDKVFRYISLTARYPCEICVMTENGSRTIAVRGSDNVQRFKLDLRGRTAIVEFRVFFADAYIARPVIELSLI